MNKWFECSVCYSNFSLKEWVYNNRKKKNPNGVICCSCSCAQKLKTGNKAPNWKGNVSQNHYKRHRKPYPEKYKAQNAIQRAVQNRELKRADSCSRCLVKCKTEAHHSNYEEQLNVIWLCHKCHMGEHYGKSV